MDTKKPNEWISFVINFAIELLAAFDLAGDIFMLYGMINSSHTAWMTLTIF